jgi:hypothetical protein
VAAFIRKLTKYIHTAQGAAVAGDEVPANNRGKKNGRTSTPDHAHNAIVEQAAVNAVWDRYEDDGYTLKSVEAECLGWDLEAVKGKTSLRVEVKGTSGDAIYFELTPNEYAKLKEHNASYRVCVVCEALTNPRIFELKPKAIGKGWRLVSKGGDVTVPLMERIAAIGAEVAQDEGAA